MPLLLEFQDYRVSAADLEELTEALSYEIIGLLRLLENLVLRNLVETVSLEVLSYWHFSFSLSLPSPAPSLFW